MWAVAVLISVALAFSSTINPAFASTSTGSSSQADSSSSKSYMLSLTLAKVKKGLVKVGSYYYYYKNGKKLKSKWRTIKGKRYYFKANGRAATGSYKVKSTYYIFDSKGRLSVSSKPKVTKVGSNRFVSGAKGKALKGWQVVSGKLYYASTSGKCAKSKTVDKIPLTKSCYAKTTNVRTKLMIKALSIISQITDSKMTQYQKLCACLDYLKSFRFVYSYFPPSAKDGWQYEWALKTFDSKVSNCWGYTSCFGAFAKALGINSQMVFRGYSGNVPSSHCWIRINGKHWDNVGWAKGATESYYSLDERLTKSYW